MFFKKKKRPITISSFAYGKCVDITDVPDPVFSDKCMGDGIAIIPDKGEIYSPVNAKVKMVMPRTHHAVGLLLDDGTELLIHVGLDTIDLKDPMEIHINQGDEVKVNDLLITYNKEKLNQENVNDITMLVVLNNQITEKSLINNQVSIDQKLLKINPLN